jgi:NAD+ synthase (glutamine-hydrolysing)
MRVALAQLNPVSGDIDGNAERITAAIDEARRQDADLIVAPEMALPGYCIGDLVEDVDFLAANEQAIERIATAARGITAVVGFIDFNLHQRNDNGTVRKYNAAAVVRDGRILQRARKSLLPNYRYFDDKRFFAPGEVRQAIDLPARGGVTRVGVSICEDMWDEFYEVKPLPELAAQGAAIILNLNASPFYPGKRHERDALIRRHVAGVRKPLVYVNTVGVADNGKNVIAFDGESLVYDEHGRLIAIGPQFAEELLVVDLGPGATPHAAAELPEIDRERETYDALVMGLRDYMRKSSFTRTVVPVSGGIDSALALAIAVDAVGAGQVLAYNLPSEHNTETTRSIAKRLTAALGVEYGVIPISPIDEEVRRTFEQHAHPMQRSLTRENLHARIRGLLMMAESNDTGALLISCGNETEIALGYATLYGDMCGGISVIGDLSKVDVYRLARYVNTRHQREIVPEETFTLKPSAELAANQFDPFDYYVMAPVVTELAERRRGPSELVALFEKRALDPARFAADPDGQSVYDKHSTESFQAVVYEAFQRMRRSVYKRLQGPPILAVSERAFGFDLRETIINGWDGGQDRHMHAGTTGAAGSS